MRVISVALLTAFILLQASAAWAACASPAAPAGRIDYFSSSGEQVFQYCNGADWVPWAGEPVTGAAAPQYSGSGGGSSLWTAGSGDAIYYNSGTPLVGIGDTAPSVALDVVGDINYTGVIVDVSDIRMKYDIQPLDSPLRKLTSLNGFSFKMKGDEKQQVEYGVSAQDVQQVFPELVRQVDADGTLGVSYDGLIAPMIEAIKELKAENAALRARVDALELQQKRQVSEQ